jgi:hypothetical protein
MAVDERRRSALYQRAADVLGQEHADTMFELLPPSGTDLATRQAMDLGFEVMGQRFEEVDRRFEEVDRRFEEIDRRFEEQREHFDERLDHRLEAVKNEIVAAFRGELVTAVAGQTRAVMLAVVTTSLAIGGMALALAQLL